MVVNRGHGVATSSGSPKVPPAMRKARRCEDGDLSRLIPYRAKDDSDTTSLRLPKKLRARLDRTAEERGYTRTELIIMACEWFLNEDERLEKEGREPKISE